MEKSTWTLGILIVVMIILSVVLTANPVQKIQTAPAQIEKGAPQTAPATNNPGTAPVGPESAQ